MTSGRNTPRNDNEQTNVVSPQQDANLAERLVRKFLDDRLHGEHGADFFNAAKGDRGAGALNEFKAYWDEKKEWSDPDAQRAIEAVKGAYLYRELISMGAGFSSKRKSLFDVIAREYDLNNEQKDRLKRSIDTQSFDDLSGLLKRRHDRKKFVGKIFRDSVPTEYDMGKQFDQILAGKTLTGAQKESVARLVTSSGVAPEDLDNVLLLFPSPTDKQLIIKFFLPTITLGELAKLTDLPSNQVEQAIKVAIQQDHFDADFKLSESDLQEVINKIDPNEIILPTALFPDTVVNAILSSHGKKKIIEAIEETNQEILEEYKNGNTLGLVPDRDGKLLPAFVETLRELGIANPEAFKPGSFIRGKIKHIDGKIQEFHLAITAIADDPVANRANGGKWKFVTIKDIRTADGGIDKNWKQKENSQDYSYADIHALLKKAQETSWPDDKVSLATDTQMNDLITKWEVKEKVLRSDIVTLADLNAALDSIDANGKKYPIEKGSTIQRGNPDDKENFWVFQVKSINNGMVALSDGTSQEYVSFQSLFDTFESGHDYTRLPKMTSPAEFLAALQSHGPKSGDFSNIIYDSERGFIPADRKEDKDFPSITQFSGTNNTISMFDGLDPLSGGWLRGEWINEVKENEKDKIKWVPAHYKDDVKGFRGGWNALYSHFILEKATPKIPDASVKILPPKEKKGFHEKHGFFKHYMGNPSIHDMMAGAKNWVEFIKHKLEHGSKLNAAKFQLALGEKLGFGEDMMREARSQVHTANKELMEKEVKWFPSSTPERHKMILNILKSHWSHDYEIQAAILSMLKKHATLYAGGLRHLDGTYIFFERLSGTHFSEDNPHVIRAREECKKTNTLFREEYLIESYLKWAGSADGWYQLDWGLWTEVKNSWIKEGIPNQTKAGEDQADTLGNFTARLQFVYDKFEWGDYSDGIGGMRKVWSKWGPAHLMHLPAIYIALSNIPSRLHGSQIDALKNEFLANGHPYPALAFLFSEDVTNPEAKLQIFRNTIKKLCADNQGMRDAYAAIESGRSGNVADTMKNIRTFWDNYGLILHKKLIMNEDLEILHKSKTDETYAAYVKQYKSYVSGAPNFNKDQISNDTYKFETSWYVWSPDKYLEQIRVNQWPGGILLDDPATKLAWPSYLSAIAHIKSIHVSDDPVVNRAFQLERYREYHSAFYKIILPQLGANWASDIVRHTYMGHLAKLGFSVPTWREKERLETAEYDALVRSDFESYIGGGARSVSGEADAVQASVSDLIAGATNGRSWQSRED